MSQQTNKSSEYPHEQCYDFTLLYAGKRSPVFMIAWIVIKHSDSEMVFPERDMKWENWFVMHVIVLLLLLFSFPFQGNWVFATFIHILLSNLKTVRPNAEICFQYLLIYSFKATCRYFCRLCY